MEGKRHNRQEVFDSVSKEAALLRKERRGEGLQNSMSNEVAHTKWWQIFEVVFGIPFLAALALSWVAPLPLPHGFLTPVLVPAGVMLIIAGGSLVVLARRELARYGQPTDPGHPTRKIVSTGVFSVSRNPLYLGGTFVLAGISFGMPSSLGVHTSHPVHRRLPVSARRTGGTVSCCQVRGAIPAVHRERPPLDWSTRTDRPTGNISRKRRQ